MRQKGNTMLILAIIVLVALGFWWLMKNGEPAITSTADLDVAAKSLDGTDLNQMDPGINQISSDSSSF